MGLAAYLDESGTDTSGEVMTLAGFVSSTEQWAEFSERWHGFVVNDWKLSAWHMADFEARRGEFKDWPRDEEAKRRLGSLLDLITEYAMCLVGVAFPRWLYRKVYKPRNDAHEQAAMYFLAAGMTFSLAGRFARDQVPPQSIDFVYEDGARGSGFVRDTYELRVPRDIKENVGFNSLTLASKTDFEPLQAADILAYETYRHFPRWAGTEKRPTRYPFEALFQGVSTRKWGVIGPDDLFEVNRLAGLDS